MAIGWAGLSMTCFAEPIQAAQQSCAGLPACMGIGEDRSEGPGGSLIYYYMQANGQQSQLAVQPCERIDSTFFAPLIPAIVGAAVLIICARKIGRLFGNHA